MAVGLALICLSIVGAGAAAAVTNPALQGVRAYYFGLLVIDGARPVGEIDTSSTGNNWHRKVLDDPFGDRQVVRVPYRDRTPANGRGIYSRIDWTLNGTYCYDATGSGIGVSAGPRGQRAVEITSFGSRTCGTGWNAVGTLSSREVDDGRFWFWTSARALDASSTSQRAQLRVCENAPAWFTDTCSGSRFLGISY